MVRHIKEAIALNKARKPLYANLTQGASVKLSNMFIRLQYFALPYSVYQDLLARKFNRQGIPIVINDLAEMSESAEYDREIKYCSKPGYIVWKELFAKAKQFRASIKRLTRHANFEGVCSISQKYHREIISLEKQHQVHLAMNKHLIESVGLTALNAIAYNKQSHGKTISLSKKQINAHSMPIYFGLRMDKKAHVLREFSCGILYNDLPHIPFIENYTQ